MRHAAVLERLGELTRGSAFPRRQAALEHLAACPECHDIADTYSAIATAMHGGDSYRPEDHPSSATLVDFAIRRGSLDGFDRTALEAHVRDCGPCRMDLFAIEQAEARLEQAPPASGSEVTRSPWIAAAAAAAIVAAILGYPAYIGVRNLVVGGPELRTPGSATKASAPAEVPAGRAGAGGPVELLVLRAPLRGAEESPKVVVASDQSVVPIAVVADDAAMGAGLRLALREDRPGTDPLWERALTVGELPASARASGMITLLLPADLLDMGAYRLTVSSGKDSEPLFEAPFEVQRHAPAATKAPQ